MLSRQSIDILQTLASYRAGKSRPTPAAPDWLDSAAKIALSTLKDCLVMESKSRPATAAELGRWAS
jgi:hypothetical protein